jgi:hypothetical protein
VEEELSMALEAGKKVLEAAAVEDCIAANPWLLAKDQPATH